MADQDRTTGGGLTQRWKEVVSGIYARMTAAVLHVGNTPVSASDPLPVTATASALPTGAATAAKQDTGNNALGATTGAAVVTDADGTIQQYLRGLVKLLVAKVTVGIDQTTPGTTNRVDVGAALPAGTNLLGKVGIDQTTPGTTNGVSLPGAIKALKAAVTITADASTAYTAVTGCSLFSRLTALLTVTLKTMDASTTLDIYIQRLLADGTTWDDIAHFAQITSAAIPNGTYVMELIGGVTGIADRATDDAAVLAAGAVRNVPWGDSIRIKAISVNFAGSDTCTIKLDGQFLP